MGTLAMSDKDLAYQELNGSPMTEARILSWAKAIAKSRQMENAGFEVIDAYQHPVLGTDVIVIPSATHAGDTFHNIQTRSGYHCPCSASDACWHSAIHMRINESRRARAIEAEAKQIEANRAAASASAKRDSAFAARQSRKPSIYR